MPFLKVPFTLRLTYVSVPSSCQKSRISCRLSLWMRFAFVFLDLIPLLATARVYQSSVYFERCLRMLCCINNNKKSSHFPMVYSLFQFRCLSSAIFRLNVRLGGFVSKSSVWETGSKFVPQNSPTAQLYITTSLVPRPVRAIREIAWQLTSHPNSPRTTGNEAA